MSLRLGYMASAEQFGPNELLDFSILAEQRGFDSVFISDHVQPWRHTGGHAPFSMAWLGALALRSDAVLVFAQKVVSKAEGRRVDLATVTPSERALELARTVQKDPPLVELVLRESRRIVRCAKEVLIVEHRLGLIMANAGIDQSNVADPASGEFALLLPEDPDASAARLRARLCTLTGCEPGVVISDSFGRPCHVKLGNCRPIFIWNLRRQNALMDDPSAGDIIQGTGVGESFAGRTGGAA